MTQNDTTKITHNDDGTVTIETEVPAEDFTKHRSTAVQALGKDIAIDGFRKGHVPENILLKHVGEHAILHEMAERALREHYPSLLKEHAIDAIGHPDITITKIALGNPLAYKATTAVMPKITLPDYKKIARDTMKKQNVDEPSVDDAEVETFITNLLRQKHVSEGGKGDDALPELTDEMVKTFGNFTDVADFRNKIKESMLIDKKRQAKEGVRIALIDALLAQTEITLPDVLVNTEVEKMLAQFKGDIERMGMKVDDYMKKLSKTDDDLRKEFRPDALKQAKTQLVLNAIAKEENIVPDTKDVEREVGHIMNAYSNATKDTATVYVTTILTNEKVLTMLEELV